MKTFGGDNFGINSHKFFLMLVGLLQGDLLVHYKGNSNCYRKGRNIICRWDESW